jgi:hypothetical protein
MNYNNRSRHKLDSLRTYRQVGLGKEDPRGQTSIFENVGVILDLLTFSALQNRTDLQSSSPETENEIRRSQPTMMIVSEDSKSFTGAQVPPSLVPSKAFSASSEICRNNFYLTDDLAIKFNGSARKDVEKEKEIAPRGSYCILNDPDIDPPSANSGVVLRLSPQDSARSFGALLARELLTAGHDPTTETRHVSKMTIQLCGQLEPLICAVLWASESSLALRHAALPQVRLFLLLYLSFSCSVI